MRLGVGEVMMGVFEKAYYLFRSTVDEVGISGLYLTEGMQCARWEAVVPGPSMVPGGCEYSCVCASRRMWNVPGVSFQWERDDVVYD